MNIIVVDDEVPAVDSIMLILNESGIIFNNIYTAYSFQSAVELLGKTDIDILITDIKMKDGTGLELVRWVNEHEIKCIKLILTSYPDFSFAQTAISEGVSEYLLKPISKDKLTKALKKAVSEAEKLQKVKAPSQMTEMETLIRRTKEYISQNMSKELSRREIAGQLGISVDYLSRIFKKETNLSLSDYIKYKRIEASKKLLDSTDLPIRLVAESIGYETFSYFSSIFKKEAGMTPYEYRNRHKG